MFKVYRNSDVTTAYVVEVVADYISDIETLPTNWAPGSSCIVTEDGSVWMLGNDETWHEI